MAKTPRINGPYIEDVREHSAANEVRERMLDGLVSGYDPGGDPSPGPQSEFPMTYDRNGNLISQIVPTAFSDEVGGDYVLITYTYDAWNRLVAINYDETPRAEYDYNGLNWRIAKRAGTWQLMDDGGGGGIGSPPAEPLDQERRMFYSANWQLLEEHIEDGRDGESAFDADRHMQYVWGTRYIDDIVVRRQDSNLNGTLDKTWYHITDTLFSTVAILDDTAKLIERVSYDAYGNARHHRGAGDLDGDGATTVGDQLILLANWGNFGVGDLNRDGTVDSDDSNLLIASFGPALPAGRISTNSTDNIIGYAGYVFNAEVHGGGLYTVRHRVYEVNLSRWITHDPIGYVDGMNLYEYVRGRPTTHVDPFGLFGMESSGSADDLEEFIKELTGDEFGETRPDSSKRCVDGDTILTVQRRQTFPLYRRAISFSLNPPDLPQFDSRHLTTAVQICVRAGWTIWQGGGGIRAPRIPLLRPSASDMEGKATLWIQGWKHHDIRIIKWTCREVCPGRFRFVFDGFTTHQFVEHLGTFQIQGNHSLFLRPTYELTPGYRSSLSQLRRFCILEAHKRFGPDAIDVTNDSDECCEQ